MQPNLHYLTKQQPFMASNIVYVFIIKKKWLQTIQINIVCDIININEKDNIDYTNICYTAQCDEKKLFQNHVRTHNVYVHV